MNRIEFENTLRDLLGIEAELREMLPPDSAHLGFDTVADGQHVSSFLLERYMLAAERALDLAIANDPQPPLLRKRYSLVDERQVRTTTERVYRRVDEKVGGGLVMFSSSPWNAITSSQFYPPDRGRYRFRISGSGFQSAGRPVTFRVDAGPMLMGTKNHLVGYFDVAPDQPTVVEFVDHLEARSTLRITPYGLANAQTVDRVGADQYPGPGLAIQWLEVEGPIHDSWPPESHRRLFGDLPQRPAPMRDYRKRVEVASDNPAVDARRILAAFGRRAFRRPATDLELRPYLALVEAGLQEGRSFEQAIRTALTRMLVSPEFLFLAGSDASAAAADYPLATRLAYFLWSTTPDEELLSLAGRKQLSQPGVLRAQVERLLQDPRARAFTENFGGQWLGLRDIDFTEPDRRLYPEYDDMLREAMMGEAYGFFEAVLRGDLSLTSFVAADFTVLNERLARHYGIDGVVGHAFRRVALPPKSPRGGVMTMAAVMKVTANGTTTSPVVRGAWVLDRVLGTPPPPPPAGVPAVEPDIRGAVTVREQLAKHRQIASCAGCHTRIDPPGFALESFDVIGGFRDHYRSVGRGEPVTVNGQRMPYARGLPVDPADSLADGRRFADIDGLKKLLLADREQIARAMATRLLIYATGRGPRPADRLELEAILKRLRPTAYPFRSLIHALTASQAFRS